MQEIDFLLVFNVAFRRLIFLMLFWFLVGLEILRLWE